MQMCWLRPIQADYEEFFTIVDLVVVAGHRMHGHSGIGGVRPAAVAMRMGSTLWEVRGTYGTLR